MHPATQIAVAHLKAFSISCDRNDRDRECGQDEHDRDEYHYQLISAILPGCHNEVKGCMRYKVRALSQSFFA
jgi:hypothetical protein